MWVTREDSLYSFVEGIDDTVFCYQINATLPSEDAFVYLNQDAITCIQCELRISCALKKGERPKSERDY